MQMFNANVDTGSQARNELGGGGAFGHTKSFTRGVVKNNGNLTVFHVGSKNEAEPTF